MPVDETPSKASQTESSDQKKSRGFNYSPLIIGAFVLMGVALVYVWSHLRMTGLEYKIAEEISLKERLLEEQRKIKVEIATLKAPGRIESIAREKLQMVYPQREQVINLREDVGKR
ncbi:MAG: Cell division protein FtsL [Syntrophus sp. PtaB.Bin001]|nr:MAG: Cell division protein FtsL [Syntrophus sp. PtaB.Bin001]